MASGRAPAALCSIAVLVAVSAPARAGYEVTGEVEVTAGHDDNLLLAPDQTDASQLRRIGGVYGALSPAVSAGFAQAGHHLFVSYTGDLRGNAAVGRLLWQKGALEGALRLSPWLRLSLAGFLGRFDASAFADEQFDFLGGDAGVRVLAGERLRLSARYRFELRRLIGSGDIGPLSDRSHVGELRAAFAAGDALELALRLGLTRSSPLLAGSAGFARNRAALEAAYLVGRLEAAGDLFAGTTGLADAPETLYGGRIELRFDLGARWGLYAAGEIAASRAAPSDYARRVVTVGLWAHAAIRTVRPAAPAGPDLRPEIRPAGVRFRVLAPGATRVIVVGSWNDWAAEGAALREVDAGLWEVVAPLAPGTHRYHFLVDGKTRRPPSAPRYAPDGFGAEDGVIEIASGGKP